MDSSTAGKRPSTTQSPLKSDTKKKTKPLSETSHESKRRYDQRRAGTRVNIGYAFESWRQLKLELGLKTDADTAHFLLTSYKKKNPLKQQYGNESLNTHYENKSSILTSSTGTRGRKPSSSLRRNSGRAKCLQQDGAESKTTRVDCSQGSYEEIEVTIDGDDRNSVKNSLSDFDSDMENIEETNEQSISGADDSCEDDVSVSILPQRSIKSEPLLECKEEESEPLQNDTLQVHVKKQEEDVGEFSTSHQIHEQHGVEVSGLLNNGLVDCKPEPSSPQSCSAALHTPKTETDDVEVHQFSNKPAFSSSDWTPEPNIKTEF